MRAAVYTRISKDEDQERLGVQRQEQDLRREAERRGAEVVQVLVDNDLSGSGKVERPDFDRLIDLISNRDIDLVLAVDLDRLTRGWRPFVTLYESCERAGVTVAWLGGEANFATGSGLLEMEIRASFAREELRKIKSRTRRKHLELAENGHDAGGGRPFGYEEDRHTIRATEADLIREAANRVLSGEPLRSICTDWMARGIYSPRGGHWSATVLKRILWGARISGRRELGTVNGKRSTRPSRIMADADWPGIIDHKTSDDLRSMLADPSRTTEAKPRKYLLAGLLTCGRCGKKMFTSSGGSKRRTYACIPAPGFDDGCGHIRIVAERADAYISDAIVAAVDGGALASALALKADQAPVEELRSVERKLAALSQMWAEDQLIDAEWKTAQATLQLRQRTLQRRVQAQRRTLGLEGVTDPLGDAWPTLPLHTKRAVIEVLIESITIKPVGHRGPIFDSSRIAIRWRA